MTKQLHASISIDLPGEMFDAAQHTVKFQPLWSALLKGLDAAGIKYTVQLDTGEVRKVPAKRGRKPKATPQEAVDALRAFQAAVEAA